MTSILNKARISWKTNSAIVSSSHPASILPILTGLVRDQRNCSGRRGALFSFDHCRSLFVRIYPLNADRTKENDFHPDCLTCNPNSKRSNLNRIICGQTMYTLYIPIRRNIFTFGWWISIMWEWWRVMGSALNLLNKHYLYCSRVVCDCDDGLLCKLMLIKILWKLW